MAGPRASDSHVPSWAAAAVGDQVFLGTRLPSAATAATPLTRRPPAGGVGSALATGVGRQCEQPSWDRGATCPASPRSCGAE